nr:MAG TPA: hypothetical protein [Caudoviricetes sp.]
MQIRSPRSIPIPLPFRRFASLARRYLCNHPNTPGAETLPCRCRRFAVNYN